MLHFLVPAVFVCVGQSTACVDWVIANPPIIFGETAQLVCAPVTPNISSNNATSWIGGKDYAVLTFKGATAYPKKYAEIQRWHRSKLESILQIYKFDEMDVNVNYSCSIGFCENRKRLSLTPDQFEYHPHKDNTRVLTNFRNGYLDVIVKIIKVYPIPNCTIMFNENIISRLLTTKTSVNGIFYMVVDEVDQRYVNVCSSQLIVTCVVGKTNIPIHQETFNGCTKKKEESLEHSIYLSIYITGGGLLLAILVIGIGCLCCKLNWRVGRMLERSVVTQDNRGPAHDAGQAESHEMMSRVPRNSDNDSLTSPL